MEAAKKSAADLQLKYNSLRQSVQRQRTELAQAGINTRTLSADERRLKTSISETTAQLNRQRDALARVSQQQARLSAVKAAMNPGNSSPPVRVMPGWWVSEWLPPGFMVRHALLHCASVLTNKCQARRRSSGSIRATTSSRPFVNRRAISARLRPFTG